MKILSTNVEYLIESLSCFFFSVINPFHGYQRRKLIDTYDFSITLISTLLTLSSYSNFTYSMRQVFIRRPKNVVVQKMRKIRFPGAAKRIKSRLLSKRQIFQGYLCLKKFISILNIKLPCNYNSLILLNIFLFANIMNFGVLSESPQIYFASYTCNNVCLLLIK